MSTHVHRYKESREDRNKRIAIEAIALATNAIALLRDANSGIHRDHTMPEDLEAFHKRWETRTPPVTWTRPGQLALDPDEWCTANELGAYLDKDPATIRRWHYRGHISSIGASDGTPLYRVGEVVAYEAKRRVVTTPVHSASCTGACDVS